MSSKSKSSSPKEVEDVLKALDNMPNDIKGEVFF